MIQNRTATRLAIVLAFGTLSAYAVHVPVAADAHVNSSMPTNNFGALGTLNVGNGQQAMVNFDVERALPAGLTSLQIAKATLYLYVNRVAAPGAINVNVASSPWTESTVNHNNGPLPGLALATSVAVSAQSAGTWIAVDVTPGVRSWFSTFSFQNHGFLIQASPSHPGTHVFFDSKENTGTSRAAVLDIVLSGPAGPQGPQGPAGPQGAVGPAATLQLEYRVSTTFLEASSTGSHTMACEAGEKLVGGGCALTSNAGNVPMRLLENFPNGISHFWFCRAANDSSSPVRLTVSAICAR